MQMIGKGFNIIHAKTEDEKMHDFFIEALTKTFNKYAEYNETHTILIGEENDPEYFTVDNVKLEKDKDIDTIALSLCPQVQKILSFQKKNECL